MNVITEAAEKIENESKEDYHFSGRVLKDEAMSSFVRQAIENILAKELHSFECENGYICYAQACRDENIGISTFYRHTKRERIYYTPNAA